MQFTIFAETSTTTEMKTPPTRKQTAARKGRSGNPQATTYHINRQLVLTRSTHTLREKRVELLLAVLTKAPQEKFDSFECEFGSVERLSITDPRTGEEKDSFYDIRIKLRDILGAEYKPGKEYNNREAAVEAIKGYNSKPIEILSEDGKKWIGITPFSVMAVDADKNYAYLRVTSQSWNYFRGLDNNYTKLDVGLALGLSSKHSLTMLMLCTGLQYNLKLNILTAKELFGAEAKYPNSYDFIKNVLEKAKKELAMNGVHVNYEIIRGTGRNHPVTGVKFLGLSGRNKKEAVKSSKIFPLSSYFSEEELDELRNIYTDEEIGNNLNTFCTIKTSGQLNRPFVEKIRELHIKSKDKTNPKGWIIASLKSVPEKKIKPMQFQLPFPKDTE